MDSAPCLSNTEKERKLGDEGYEPLFETERGKRRGLYRLYSATVLACICMVWVYRVRHMPSWKERGYFSVWLGMLGAELWFGLYWLLSQPCRLNPVVRRTSKHRLSQRYETILPKVDVFVCTADPVIEPPLMVMNTVLSAMAIDYPAEKLSVYVSDDACAEITFYALLEALEFAKHWIPFCKRFNVEPRSPNAYFASMSSQTSPDLKNDLDVIEKLYEEMKNSIESAARLGQVPEEARVKHKGFSQWDSYSSRGDHGTILQVLGTGVGGQGACVRDTDSLMMPMVVYLSREKRPHHPHRFKAGAMNALIRVSSRLSCGEFILNLDCDMYVNNTNCIRDALCFFLEENEGPKIAFVQFPQKFENITRNDLYGNLFLVATEVEFPGADGLGGPLYIGTGCFHRRDVLCGRKYGMDWKRGPGIKEGEEISEESLKILASCTYEEGTKWGKEMGLRYGSAVEDVVTGLALHRQGWKSVYFNPKREAFVGIAPNTLLQGLVQHKRWSEGHLQIVLSDYSPINFCHGKISFGHRLAYCVYNFWAFNCLAAIYYSTVPCLCLLSGATVFPQSSSPWFVPFAYVTVASAAYSLAEFLWSGGTVRGWWNDQRIWHYRRTSSYLFGFIDAILKLLGFRDSAFAITAKTTDDDESERYEKEVMEFGADSPMFTVLTTIALLNLFCFVGAVKVVVMGKEMVDHFQTMVLQVLLCGTLILINLPLYEALCLRKDKGKMPVSVTAKSAVIALSACACFRVLY